MTHGPGALVLGGDYKSLGIVRSLGRQGIPVWVMCDDHVLGGLSRYCGRRLVWPALPERELVAMLLDLARDEGIDGWALFPDGDETAALIARNRDALASRYRLSVLADWDTLRWAYDKRLTYELASRIGVDHPVTRYPRDRDGVLSFDGPFPAILKPAIRPVLNRFTIAKAWRADDAPTLAARYDEARTLLDPTLIMVQSLVQGDGASQLSFAALCRDGAPIAYLSARRERQWPMDFGRASTFVETIDAPDVEEAARRVIAALRFDGLIEIEFKRDTRDGVLKLLDINPRVWGWHTLGRRAGIDFPYLLWRVLHGLPVAETRGRAGVRWVRALTDVPVVWREMRAGRMSPASYLSSLRRPIEHAVLAADDPLPALLEVPVTLRVALARRGAMPGARVARGVV